MECKVLIVGISDETWYRGTKDERVVKTLNCLDRVTTAGQKLKNTFDYTPDSEELKKINLSALEMQPMTLGVSEWFVNNGRLKARGRIVLDSVPPHAMEGSVAAAIVRDTGSSVLNGTSAVPAKAGK